MESVEDVRFGPFQLKQRDERLWRGEVRATAADVDAGMPESLRQLIEAQLDGLSAEDQRLAEAARGPNPWSCGRR